MISALSGVNMNRENPMHKAPPTSKPIFTMSGNPLFGKIPAKNKQIPMNNNSIYQKPMRPPLFNLLISGRFQKEKGSAVMCLLSLLKLVCRHPMKLSRFRTISVHSDKEPSLLPYRLKFLGLMRHHLPETAFLRESMANRCQITTHPG